MTRDGSDAGRQLSLVPHLGGQSLDEQLHEVRASFAGLSRAVHLLIHHGAALPETRKRRLERLLESEVLRLERMLFDRRPHPQGAVVVTDAIAPVVDARRLAGQEIRMASSPSVALCVPDLLAEAVNILLVNAAKHAGGTPTTVDIVETGEDVQVHVSDRGPGIPQRWRDRVFEPGFRGGAVAGHGLGLAVARRLMAAQQGSARLMDTAGPGATFVLSVPRQRRRT